LHGDDYGPCIRTCDGALPAQAEPGPSCIPSMDPDVIAGQGTIAMEILRQRPWRRKSMPIFCAGRRRRLDSRGIAAYAKSPLSAHQNHRACSRRTRGGMYESLRGGKARHPSSVWACSPDGWSAVAAGGARRTFRLARQYVDEIVVGDDGSDLRRHSGYFFKITRRRSRSPRGALGGGRQSRNTWARQEFAPNARWIAVNGGAKP